MNVLNIDLSSLASRYKATTKLSALTLLVGRQAGHLLPVKLMSVNPAILWRC